jgi:hypothetical protein
MQTHESFDRTYQGTVSSDKSFGLVFAAFFAIVAGVRFWNRHADARWWVGAAIVFALLALFWRAPLAPLNRLWARVGLLLHAIVNPAVMVLIFAVAIVPTALMMRLLRKDPLRLRRDPSAKTYWIECDAPPRAGSMTEQF